MCTLPLFAPPQRIAEPTPFLFPFFLPPEISSFWGTSIAVTPSKTQEVLLIPAGSIRLGHISVLLALNDSDTPTLLHRSTGSRSSPYISFTHSSLAFSCSWEVLQDLGSDHLPILSYVRLSPTYRPNKRPPSFNFQKASWDGFASYFDFPSAKEYSSLSLFSAAALFTSLALNASKSSIPFSCIKRYF